MQVEELTMELTKNSKATTWLRAWQRLPENERERALQNVLDEMVRDGDLVRTGSGTENDPYMYRTPNMPAPDDAIGTCAVCQTSTTLYGDVPYGDICDPCLRMAATFDFDPDRMERAAEFMKHTHHTTS